jgi:peptidoglycan/LPS O-acetylase OafA/YrhL
LVTLIIAAVLVWTFFALTGRFPIFPSNDIYHFGLNLLLLQSSSLENGMSFNAVSWSIAQESLCYVIFFLICLRPRLFMLSCAALVILGLYLIKEGPHGPFLNFYTGRAFTGFFIGCLLELALSSTFRTLATYCAVCLLAGFAITIAIDQSLSKSLPWGWGEASLLMTYALVVFPSTLVAALNLKFAATFLSSRPLTYLGRISYSIYMVHLILQMTIMIAFTVIGMPVPVTSTMFFILYGMAVLLIASATYKYLEIPAQQFIRERYLHGTLGDPKKPAKNSAAPIYETIN